MILGKVFERFVEKTPLAVLSRSLLERAFSFEAFNAVFENKAQTQYQRELVFADIVDLLGQVVTSAYPSVHAAHKSRHFGTRNVHVNALYDKLKGIEPAVSAGLVTHSAQQLLPIIHDVGGALPEPLPGYQMHVLDGNAIASTEHRLKETRSHSAAPLPGKSLCVFRPAYQLVTDIVLCEDGHAQERSLVDPLLERIQKRSVWVADRNFCFQRFLLGIMAKLGFFVIREHAGLSYQQASKLRQRGRSKTGKIWEQSIFLIDEQGKKRRIRRVVVKLDKQTQDGDWELAILTNLPKDVGAVVVSETYRQRWTIEKGFLDMTTTLACEINTLCYPKAALLVFCVAVMAYNLQSAIKGVLRSVHGAVPVEEKLSRYYMGDEIGQVYRGMMVALPPEEWSFLKTLSQSEFVSFLKHVASQVDLDRYSKSRRGEKKPQPKRHYDPQHPHVSVAKILLARL